MIEHRLRRQLEMKHAQVRRMEISNEKCLQLILEVAGIAKSTADLGNIRYAIL